MNAHHPGPWNVRNAGFSEDGFARYELHGIRHVCKPDADLIASAPDLLIERDRLKAINAELIAACEAFAEYDNSASRAARAGVDYAQLLIAKYEIANTQCRAALASATGGKS